MLKVIVVGSSHAGYEALEEMLQSGKDYDLHWFEQGDYLSFMSWGMYLYLDGTVKDVDTIRYSSAEAMRQRGVTVYPGTQVLQVLPDSHEILVKDLKSGEETKHKYDKLILGTGVAQNIPDWETGELDNVFHFGGRDSAELLRKKEVEPSIKDVVIIGGGYISVEAAMCFAKAGKKVTFLMRDKQLLSAQLDADFAGLITEEMEKNGIVFKPETNVKTLEGKDGAVTKVITDKGDLPADLVLVCIGTHPATAYLKGALDMNERGFIITDEYMKTSAPDVFAAGSATLMKYNPTAGKVSIDLATNGRKQGRTAAKNLEGDVFAYPGMQGTSGLKIFDYYKASTGLNTKTAGRSKVNFGSVTIETTALDSYLPEALNATVHAKLFYDKDTRRVLGGQILSKKDLTGLIQALSMVIYAKMTIDELAFADFFFQPGFNRPWNLLNELGLAAQKQEG